MASFSIMAVLGADISGFVSGMNSAKGVADSAGSAIGGRFGGAINNGMSGANMALGLGRKIAGVAAAIGATKFAGDMIEMGGRIADLSAKLGISTDDVQAWDHALTLSGGSIESASKAFTKLGQSIIAANSGDKDAIERFKQIGIAVDTLKGKTAGPVMLEIAKRFGADGSDGAAMEGALLGLAGKSAESLFAPFRSDAAGEVGKFLGSGSAIKPGDIQSLDRAGDAMDKVNVQKNKIGAPIVAFGVDHLSKKVAFLGVLWAAAASAADSAGKAIGRVLGISQESEDSIGGGLNSTTGETGATASSKKKSGLGLSVQDAAQREWQNAMQKKHASEDQTTAKLHEQLGIEQRKGQLAAMTDQQRAAALRDEIEALKIKADMTGDEPERLRLKTKAQKLQNDLDSDERKAEKAEGKAAKAKPPERNMVNSLQQIGGMLGTYVQAPEIAALDLQRRSEDHLRSIRQSLLKVASAGGFGSPDE